MPPRVRCGITHTVALAAPVIKIQSRIDGDQVGNVAYAISPVKLLRACRPFHAAVERLLSGRRSD